MRQGLVSQATHFELAQFIKPGPVHKPEFTRRRHLQQTAAAHSWWEGQADVQGKSKEGDRGKFMSQRLPTSMRSSPSPPQRQGAAGGTRGPRPVCSSPGPGSPTQKHCGGSTWWQRQLSSPVLPVWTTTTLAQAQVAWTKAWHKSLIFLNPLFHCYTKPSVLQCAALRKRLEAFERQVAGIRLFILDEVKSMRRCSWRDAIFKSIFAKYIEY